MREDTWRESTRPARLLNELKVRSPGSARKFRLFGVACCRRIGDLLDGTARQAIDSLERFADGLATEDEVAALARQAMAAAWDKNEISWASHAAEAVSEAVAWEDEHQRLARGPVLSLLTRVAGAAYHAAYARAASVHVGERAEGWQDAIRAEESAQADLVREVFGNVFRPVAFDPQWRTLLVQDLARSIERTLDFDALPALGDALEEAGCDQPEVLDHCRKPAGHVRGCWALDATLGRAP